MTDTAWISLAIIVVVVAVCILIVVVKTARMKNFLLRFPVPFLDEPFVLSPHDSESVHRENLMRCTADLFKVFLELTKRGEGIDTEAIQRTDIQILKQFMNLNLLHSEGGRLDPASIKLGYFGWQALQNYLRQNKLADNPRIEPWSWPQNFGR